MYKFLTQTSYACLEIIGMKTTFYTGKGDKGKTLLGKCSYNKDEPLFEALGTLDELNSVIGFCRIAAHGAKFNSIKKSLLNVQQNLFIAQAEIALLGFEKKIIKQKNDKKKKIIKITADKTTDIEYELHAIDKKLPELKNFIISGGSELASRLDVARAVSRRLERRLVTLARSKKINKDLLQYCNRLSSLLFALARLVDHISGVRYEHPKYK